MFIDPTGVLTIHNIAWGQIPLPGPSDFALFDADSLYPVIVSGSIHATDII